MPLLDKKLNDTLLQNVKEFHDFMDDPFRQIIQNYANELLQVELIRLRRDPVMTPEGIAITRTRINLLEEITDGVFWHRAYERNRDAIKDKFRRREQTQKILDSTVREPRRPHGSP